MTETEPTDVLAKLADPATGNDRYALLHKLRATAPLLLRFPVSLA